MENAQWPHGAMESQLFIYMITESVGGQQAFECDQPLYFWGVAVCLGLYGPPNKYSSREITNQ